jgi:hypothetical protein
MIAAPAGVASAVGLHRPTVRMADADHIEPSEQEDW